MTATADAIPMSPVDPPGEDRRAERERRCRATRHARQREQQRERPEAEPRRFEDQLEAEHAHQQPEAELKPGAHRLRDGAREPTDPAGNAQDEQHDADHHPGGGDLAGRKAARQDHRRDRLHRLHRQRQAIEQPGRDQESGEAEQHAGRGQTGDCHRADHMRNEGAEIAARAAAFQEEAPYRQSGGTLGHAVSIAETCAARAPSDFMRDTSHTRGGRVR